MAKPKPLFPFGRICITPGVQDLIENDNLDPLPYMLRHLSGDWGELDSSDKKLNNDALKYGARIFSSYQLDEFCKIWIITEADRSSTTILFRSEY